MNRSDVSKQVDPSAGPKNFKRKKPKKMSVTEGMKNALKNLGKGAINTMGKLTENVPLKNRMSGGGKMKKKMMSAGGGPLKMVTNKQGDKVPFYAADGVGKMKKGGAVKGYKPGGSVKSGKPRGCGMASKGVRNAKMITMKGS